MSTNWRDVRLLGVGVAVILFGIFSETLAITALGFGVAVSGPDAILRPLIFMSSCTG